MKVSQGIHYWLEYHNLHSKKHPKTYQSILSKRTARFGERDLKSLTSEEVLSFLTQINQGTKQLTKRTRYSQLTLSSTSLPKMLIPISEAPVTPLC